MIPIRNLILEGVDASGKSTLYRNIHRATDFRNNIIDRSTLSALCYSRLYGRDTSFTADSHLNEVCDANNFFVVLLPPLDVVLQRLRVRGDEYQDEASLTRLHGIFESEVARIEDLPNVCVIREPIGPAGLTEEVTRRLSLYSSKSPNELGAHLIPWTALTSFDEVQLRVSFVLAPGRRDPSILNHPHEGQYYRSILSQCRDVIEREASGINPYGVPQDSTSRRFYYNSDTCISSIHFLPRGDTLRVMATLRSTDAAANGSPDLQFLEFLAGEVQSDSGWGTSRIVLDVRFNSLHFRRDRVL